MNSTLPVPPKPFDRMDKLERRAWLDSLTGDQASTIASTPLGQIKEQYATGRADVLRFEARRRAERAEPSTTETADPQSEQIGAALGRIRLAVRRHYRVETDGQMHHPVREVETLGADLGFVPGRPTDMRNAADLYGPFVRDEKMAAWQRNWNLGTALRVLAKAGADPDDVAVLREALGVPARDESHEDRADAHNEQAHQYWVDQFQQQQAIAVANARDDEHRTTVAQVHAELNSAPPAPELHGPSMSVASAYYAEDGQVVTVAGRLRDVTRRVTKQGRAWASVTLADESSHIEVLVFPNRYEVAEALVVDDAEVVVVGRLDRRDGPARIMAASVQSAGAMTEPPA